MVRMKKLSKKDITNEDLAQMVANGFSDVHKQIGDLNTNLSSEISEVREIIKNTRQSVLTVGDKFVGWLKIIMPDGPNHRGVRRKPG